MGRLVKVVTALTLIAAFAIGAQAIGGPSLNKKIKRLNKRLTSLERQPGPQGIQGPQGPQGIQGLPGPGTIIASGTFTADYEMLAAGDCNGTETSPAGIGNAVATDSVLVSPGGASHLSNLVIVTGSLRVDGGTKTVQIRLCNQSVGAIDPPELNYNYIVFRPG